MATTAGELREALISAIEDVKSGKLDYRDANAIANLAKTVTESMRMEIEARQLMVVDKSLAKQLGAEPLILGDERRPDAEGANDGR